jgi:hypothetical protein
LSGIIHYTRKIRYFSKKPLYLYNMNDKKIKKVPERKKYERIIEHDDCTMIWKYDNYRSNTGPYEVEIRQKKVKLGILP